MQEEMFSFQAPWYPECKCDYLEVPLILKGEVEHCWIVAAILVFPVPFPLPQVNLGEVLWPSPFKMNFTRSHTYYLYYVLYMSPVWLTCGHVQHGAVGETPHTGIHHAQYPSVPLYHLHCSDIFTLIYSLPVRNQSNYF